jgi:tetratricopeptide (TPR) repeat protein
MSLEPSMDDLPMPFALPARERARNVAAGLTLSLLLGWLLAASQVRADPELTPLTAPRSGVPIAPSPGVSAPANAAQPPAQPSAAPDAGASQPAASGKSATEVAGVKPVEAQQSAAPKSELDPDLVYAVLVAEIAARRGDMPTAFKHYLYAAQLSRDPKMAELAVRAGLTADDNAAAEEGLNFWLKLTPDSVTGHQLAALLRIKANDREGALTHLARLVDLGKSDAANGYNQAVAILGRVPDASARVALMRSLVEMHPGSADAQQALATIAAGAGETDVAADAARRASDLRPGWSAPRTFLVKLLISQGKRDDARAILEELVTENPDDQALSTLYGQLLVEEKDYAKARDVFERLLKAQADSAETLFAAGVLALELDDLDAARAHFERLYRVGERRDDATYYLGQVEERAKRPEAAIEWYSKSGGANELESQVRIAVLRAQAGEVDRAREMVQQLRDRAPDEARSLYAVESEILDQAGRPEEAMAVYGEGLKAFPDDPDLLYGRAMYAIKRDRLDLAEVDLKLILAANPDHADALNALGYSLADRTDRYTEALGYIEHAIKLKPDEPAIQDSMGWVQYKLGRPDLALDYLQRAFKEMDDGEIAAHLGEVLWALGRQDEARAVWEGALKTHADHPYLKTVVERHRVAQSEHAQ